MYQQGGFPQHSSVVPNPVRKDTGNRHDRLMPDSADDNQNAAARNKVVSFGPLGSFTFNTLQLLPVPQLELPPPQQPMSSKDTSYVYKMGKEECKKQLEVWAGSKCCRSKKPAIEGHIGEVYTYNALSYTLETFNEKRGLVCQYVNCRPGESIDPPGTAPYPNVWSLGCMPSNNFRNEVKRLNYPHTDVIQPCFACNAYGELRCSKCSGGGRVQCSKCNGRKTVQVMQQEGGMVNETCPSCQGVGNVVCIRCSGDGKVICGVCNGIQVLKWFLQVEVQYINHVDEYLKEKTDLPDELLKNVKGEILHQDEGVQILPIEDSDNTDVIENSRRLIQKANQGYGQEKRILQRHVLNCITCAECEMQYSGQDFKFWVYGEEKQVYCPEYPSKCCCTIL